MSTFRRHALQALLCSALAGLLGLTLVVPATASAVAQAKLSTAAPDCRPAFSFNRNDFPAHPKIDNKFLPLAPGIRTVLSGTVLGDDGRLHTHDIVAIATGVTKVLNGVRTLVLFERDYQDGKLQESELAFEAQDKQGRVWNIGEYPEEYQDGKLVGADSTWIAGIDGARAGMNMLAHPSLGNVYLQGSAPTVDFRDCAAVYRTDQRICLPGRCYDHVLVTDEWAPLDVGGGHQRKYYAPGVGAIKVGAVGGTNQEVLRLTERTRLCPAELARVTAAVIAQDRRGYWISSDVYGHTARAH